MIKFNIYIVQINTQEDMIKCALHIKIESKITMLPIYNFVNSKIYTIWRLKRNYKLHTSLKPVVSFKQWLKGMKINTYHIQQARVE